ncbi:MAG: lysylphosphatidylglycerol synthase domain-containing protein [Crocinitomicaceae bacterium]
MNAPNKNKVFWIKLVFGLALLLFILWKVRKSFLNSDFDELDFTSNFVPFLVIVICLMPINWLVESVKWHLLIQRIQPQSFWKTIRDVLAGVSTSLITPNRIGNFVGRTVNLPKDLKAKAIIATIHSNLAQFISSICFGLIGLLFINLNQGFIESATVSWSGLLVLLVALFFYSYPKVLDVNPIAKMFSQQTKDGIANIQEASLPFKGLILILSMLRYAVFLSQFYLLLLCFQTDLIVAEIIPAIAVVFLITTIIPSFLFGKLFVREASALFVLIECGIPTPVILFTVFLLWMINLAVPSLIGGSILMRSK